jgi:hypothetical protein
MLTSVDVALDRGVVVAAGSEREGGEQQARLERAHFFRAFHGPSPLSRAQA